MRSYCFKLIRNKNKCAASSRSFLDLWFNTSFLIATLLTLTSSSYSQTILTGAVVNQENDPIPYANIGIVDTEVGTISNEDGSFRISIPATYNDHQLLFSSIGYEQTSVPVNSATGSSNLQIQLKKKITELPQLVVYPDRKKNRFKELGNNASLFLSGELHYDSVYAGSAMALLIDRSNYSSLKYLNSASLYIAKNLSPKFKVRFRVMSVDPENMQPEKDLLHQSVVLNSDKRRGWMTFELEENLYLQEDRFYVVFEWILDQKDRKHIANAYSNYMETYPERVSYDTTIIQGEKVSIPQINKVLAGTIFGTTLSKKALEDHLCYYRSNSFGEWKKASGILSAKVELSEYPISKPKPKESTDLRTLHSQVDKWAVDFKDKYDIEGLQLSIGKGDSLFFSNGYGFADKETKEHVQTNTQFRIASVSKTMTAVAIMRLSEKGLIDLEQPIQQYVPEFPLKNHPVTVKQLLAHLGGIKDYDEKSWNEIFIQKQYNRLIDALELFEEDSLVSPPGSVFSYSSYGYILLGAAIENITDRSYLQFMENEIWSPAQMNDTFGEIADSSMANKSKFYFTNGEEATGYNLSYSYPSGGLLSTTNDLVRFGNALLKDQLLDHLTRDEMFQIQKTNDGAETGYGLGWYIAQDEHQQPVFHHAGELPSTGAFLLISPEEGMILALLTNSPIVTDTEDELLNEILDLKNSIFSPDKIGFE